MKERIAQIIQKENLTAIQFAKKVGINPSSLSHILSGRNNASLDIIMRIHKSCDDINLNWLIYGEGNMENETEDVHITSNNPHENLINAEDGQAISEYSKENGVSRAYIPSKEVVKQEIRYVEKPLKKITEIRIFFDNGTYETFKPDNN